MIKINLIAERKAPKSKPAAAATLEGPGAQNFLLIGILVLGVIVAGVWWYAKNSALESERAQKVENEAELVRLEEVRKKGEYYKRQKELLEQQIQLITDLKKRQEVPVHILDQISKNLPDFLWLDSMSAQANQINISGKATTYNAVSNFYNSLNSSGFFQDVVLGRASESPDGVAFSLMCRFAPPSAEPPPEETQG